MNAKSCKPWSSILELAVYSRLIAERWAVECRKQAPVGKLHLGQRVRTTVDEIGIRPGCHPAPAGTVGVIATMPSEWDPDYGVILDGDPSGRRHAYGENELAPAETPVN